jgi:uncharacterized protein (PEP-CTERM system associated)
MDTTGRTEASLRGDDLGLDAARGVPSGRRLARSVFAFALLAAGASPPVLAQRWTIEPGIGSQLTWTSNSLLGTASVQQDTILEVRPQISIRGDGARLHVVGIAALNGVAYLDGSRPSQVLPEGDLSARLEAIERWLFLEAGVRAAQSSYDPFGVRPVPGTSSNTLTTTQTHFSPSIEAQIDPLTRYRIRSDNTWTNGSYSGSTPVGVTTGAAGYFGRQAASIEHDPRPLGWRLEGERNETRYRDGGTAPLVTEVARLLVNYAVTDELFMGLRGGYQRDNLAAGNGRGKIYGGQVKWQPSARTLLNAEAERRVGGSAWGLGFDHRTPQLAFNLRLSRGIETTPQSLFEFPTTGNVAALLDAMLTTRIPDPVERARAVQKLIADQGLPSATVGPTVIYSQRLSRVTTRSGSVGVIGVRNSLVLSVFDTRTEDAPDAPVLAATGAAANNNRQYGGGLTLSHRLGPFMSVAATLDWSRIVGIGAAATNFTTQRGGGLQVNLQASPHTGVVFGARTRQLDSNVTFPGHESAVFAGLNHTF